MATVIRGSDNFDTADNATQTELNAHGIGYGQTWTSFTIGVDRVNNTDYTNNTGKPITIAISCITTDGVYIDGVLRQKGDGGIWNNFCIIVPNGSTYKVNSTSSLNNWSELR